MGIEAKIIEDSISHRGGKRITTLQIKFHRFILPEFNTHRVFSRNFSSSRAIPTKKLLEQVITDPAMPVFWGKNQPGMQSHEHLPPIATEATKILWKQAAKEAVYYAEALQLQGAHKQIVNRIIEPYLWVTGIVTATEFDNWFELRDHQDAQPEIRALAVAMKDAMAESNPRVLKDDEWHLPYIWGEERTTINIDTLRKISAARCCRVSYLKHDGQAPSIDDDLQLFDRLAGAVPLHASPLEHQATPTSCFLDTPLQGNFVGWIQFRKMWEQSMNSSHTK